MAQKKQESLVTGNRSNAEELIISLLRFHFKRLQITRNDKSILGRQEIDIYLPEYKIGIEVDGVFHYKPVYGQETFERIQRADKKKDDALAKLGITLFRIRLPEVSNKTYEFLKEQVTKELAPAIKKKIEELQTIPQ